MQRYSFPHSQLRARIAIPLFMLLCFTLLAATAFAGSTVDRIKQSGHIRLGYVGDARPFSFEGQNGPDGYAVELCKNVVKSLEKQLALQGLTQDWKQVSFERRLRPVGAGDIDILCAPLNDTLSHREEVSFSIPIFAGGNRAVIRNDAPATLRTALSREERLTKPVWRGSPAATVLEQTRFVVMKGTSSEKWLEERRTLLQVDAKVSTVPDYRTGLQHVLERKADVFFGERSLVLGVLGTEDTEARKTLVVVDRLFTHEPLGLAMPRGDDDFRLLVDRALSELFVSEEFPRLYTKWCGQFDAPTRTLFLYAARGN
jgi:polar amino acid transport system substrate-binding protein